MHETLNSEDYSAYRTRFLIDVIIPQFAAPPIITAAVYQLLKRLSIIHLPISMVLIICAASIPFVTMVQVVFNDIYTTWDARRRSARVVPRVKGRWPGNLDKARSRRDQS